MSRQVAAARLVGAAVVSFGVGAAATLALTGDARRAPDSERDLSECSAACPARPAIPPEELAAAIALAALLADTTVARELDPHEPATFTEMFEKAKADPVSRRELLDRYRNAPPGDAKQMLRGVLLSLRTPDVYDLFIDLADDDDPERRRDAFEVLRIAERKVPEVRQVVMRALATEQDAEILSNAIGAMRPGIASASESAAVMEQLRKFAEHSDPQVRAQSVRGLVDWDKSGESIGVLQRALADEALEVRGAAVYSILENRVRSEELKQMLMRIANAPEESPGLRTNAVIALERYSLSSDEYARILQSATDADALMDAELTATQ